MISQDLAEIKHKQWDERGEGSGGAAFVTT